MLAIQTPNHRSSGMLRPLEALHRDFPTIPPIRHVNQTVSHKRQRLLTKPCLGSLKFPLSPFRVTSEYIYRLSCRPNLNAVEHANNAAQDASKFVYTHIKGQNHSDS
jgi:hypothetical protein